MIFRVFC